MQPQKSYIEFLVTKTMDSFKMYYEFIVPYTCILLGSSFLGGFFPGKFIPFISNFFIFSPLAYGIQYFLFQMELGRNKEFFVFFGIYNSYFRVLISKIIAMLIIMLCLVPAFRAMYDILVSFNFNLELLNEALLKKEIELSQSASTSIMASIFLVILTLPLYFFFDYFFVIDHFGLLQSLKNAYHVGVKNYFKIILILLVSFVVLFIGTIMCGFGLLIALPFSHILYYHSYRLFAGKFLYS